MSDGLPRLVATLVALVAVVAVWAWWQSSEGPGRPILRPTEFVSHEELAEFVGERLGPGGGMGSRYSYVVRTIPSSNGHILVEAVYVDDGLPSVAPPPPETGPGGVRMRAGVDTEGKIHPLAGPGRPSVLASVTDGCRQIVVSATGLEVPADKRAELTQMLEGRLSDDSRSGYGVCQ